jgi:L,D-peptidoglycan transpeptidase YkuD (ErfK/YbiS/YcfS/YnhG family)
MPTRRELLAATGGLTLGANLPSAVSVLTVTGGRVLTCGESRIDCVVGRSGVRLHKVEGDGASPAGRFPLRRVLFRPDRVSEVRSGLPVSALAPEDGWCTEPSDPNYNRQIKLPYAGSHEELWRSDSLYDVIVVLGHNDPPAVPGAGSAIFLHVAAPETRFTDGCVAVGKDALLGIVARCVPATIIAIEP